jgi:hypothetical protein
LEEFLTNSSHLDICKDQISAQNTFRKFVDLAYSIERKNWLSACPIPCKQTIYEASVRNYHKNSVFTNPKEPNDYNVAHFSIAYETFLIEVSVETLVYDIGSFFTAVGGNLGLFLGVSCLSVLLGIIKLFHKFKKCNT